MDNGTVRVLLVEDDPDDYYLTRDLLADVPGNKIVLEWASDYDAGLEAFTRCEHDAYLLDYRLGKGDGLELLREGIRRGCKAPVILLTGQGDRDLAFQALEAGAADYLVKGQIDATALERAIRYALQQKRHADDLEQKVQARTAELERTNAALRTSEERYRTLVEQVQDYAIFGMDTAGLATTWNEGVKRVLGFAEAEFIGRDLVSLIFTPEDVRSGVARRELEQAAATGKAGNDRWMRRKDGTRFFARGITTALHDGAGQLLGFTKIMRDQTEQKRLEDELRQVAADLSESDRRKTEFLAMLAHELRNPLAPIRNAVQVLRLTGGDEEAVASASAMMERQMGQMIRLVDDLLDVSRINRGKIELRKGRIELASVVHHAVEAARGLVQRLEQELTVTLPSQPIYLHADPTRLAQIVGNLLNNASKFTDMGGRIALTVERAGEQAILRVRDNGIGLAADQLPRIFELFTQVDTSLERSVSGLGIGLTLVRNLVEMHGGTVHAHSAGIGQGSEFVVRLPILTETPQPPPEPTPPPPPPAKGRRILVVDDNRDSATSLATLLRLTGHQTHTAFDGLAAVEAAATFQPDVILCDIGLPKLNGHEVARKVREQPWGKKMVLVALTGWGQDEDRERSYEAGFDSHMVKPVDYDALTKLLAELVPTPG